MKRTFQLFERENIPYDFLDYKKEPPTRELLGSFLEKVKIEDLVNKRGTTFRKLSEEDKQAVEEKEGAINILLEKSSMIKRPIIQFGDGELIVGYEEELIAERINPK